METLQEVAGVREEHARRQSFEQCTAEVRAGLGDVVAATLRAEGRAMTLEQAVAYALDEPPPA
jgi:hypothetical protein